MAFQGADPGIVGQSYEAALPLQDTQRCVNWYCEIDQNKSAKEPLALLGCPGLLALIATQAGPVRGMWVLPGGLTALVVTGNTLYLITNTIPAINGALPVFTATSVGTLLTSIGPVVMRDNGVLQNGLGGYCIIVDGSFAYYYLLSGVTYTNQFTGTLTAGSATLVFPGELPNGLIVASTPTLSATSGAIPAGTKVIFIDTIGLTLTMSANATATTTGQAITFTAPLALGATSGTLTPVWAGTTGSYTIQFSDGETRLVTLTNGSGAVTWTPGLTHAVLAAANTVSGNTVENITLSIPPFGQITDEGFLGADHIAFIEGFLVLNQPNSRTFFCTGPTPYQVLFPGLFFSLKDSSTDNLVTLYEENRELWLVGERTSEVWFNAGGANFPFQRIPGVGPQIGCSAKYSIARAGAQLVWLGKNEQGENVVVCTNQYTWARISTHAIEHAISSYSTINDAIGYGYEEEGHLFYMLTFPTADKTWCFDFTSELWHERASWDPDVGIFHRHRSNCFMNFANTRIVGDFESGNLLQMSRNFFTDNGAPLRCVRRTPHVWSKETRERLFFSQLQIEFMPAVGLQPLQPVSTINIGTSAVTPSIETLPNGSFNFSMPNASNNGHNANFGTVSARTVNANMLLLMVSATDPARVVGDTINISVTSPDLTWTRYAATQIIDPGNSNEILRLELWYAPVITALSSTETVTINCTRTVPGTGTITADVNGNWVAGIIGAQYVSFFDTAAGLPGSATQTETTGNPMSITFSTSEAKDLLFAFSQNYNGTSYGPPSGWMQVLDQEFTSTARATRVNISTLAPGTIQSGTTVVSPIPQGGSALFPFTGTFDVLAIAPGTRAGYANNYGSVPLSFGSISPAPSTIGGAHLIAFYLDQTTFMPTVIIAFTGNSPAAFAFSYKDASNNTWNFTWDGTSVFVASGPFANTGTSFSYNATFNQFTFQVTYANVSGQYPNFGAGSIVLSVAAGGTYNPFAPGINPQAMLRWSSDAGQTWSQERWASIGRAGLTKNRAMWRRLGEARDRVWEVVVTDPVRRDIIGATLFAEGSSS